MSMLFKYVATDQAGNRTSSRIEAASQQAAARKLQAMGLRPKSITQDVAKADGRKVKPRDVEMLAETLGGLLAAGVPMFRAITVCLKPRKKSPLGAVLSEVRGDLESGMPLSQAISRHPRVFDKLAIGMVSAGEENGNVEGALIRLASMMKFNREMRDGVVSALRYPMGVMLAVVAALFVVNWFVIPVLAKTFKQFGADLPVITQGLIATSEILTAIGPLLLAGIAIAVPTFKSYYRSNEGRHSIHTMMLNAPIIGSLVRRASMSRFCAALSDTQRAGVPIDRALDLAVGATGNDAAEKKLRVLKEQLAEGKPFPAAATSTGMFTEETLAIVEAADETGNLDKGLGSIADYYRQDVEKELKLLPGRINPVLMVLMGVGVLILALGVFMPLWDLANVATNKH